MCMEDVRLGRKSTYLETLVAVGATSVEACGGAPNRVALILGGPLAGTLTYSIQSPAVSGVGLNVGAGQPPVLLNVKDHGDAVTRAWQVISSGAGQTAYVGQALLKDQ